MPAGKLEPLSKAPAHWRYAAAILFAWGAVLLRIPLDPAVSGAMYLTVYPAVMLASLVLGEGPGVVSALLGTLLVEWSVPGEVLAQERWLRVGVVLFAALLVGRVAQKARRAHALLQESDRRKNEFLAVLSHELRNPLAAMRNALHILDGSEPDPDQVVRSRRILERQVQQLSLLVDDLLDVTRISRGKVDLRRSRLDLREIVTRCVEDHRGLARERGLQVALTGEDGIVAVDVDPTRITQVIGNLLTNSIEFTEPGGHVEVRVERSSGDAVVTVRDDGVGIPEDVLDHLFEPFTQADKSLHRPRGGLGLGLAVVKGLVELHGGHVEARSGGRRRGTEVTVRLPRAHGGFPAPTVASVPVSRASTSPRRILIVEDNEDAADTLQQILQRRGHTVEVARDGEQGIAQARAFRPDLVLCDIGLPRVDGYGVARAIRSDPELAGTYLVALTGYALPDDQRRAHEAGFDRHIAKPVSPSEVDDVIASARSPEAA